MSTLTMLAIREVAKRCFETTQRAANTALVRLMTGTQNSKQDKFRKKTDGRDEAACVLYKTGTDVVSTFQCVFDSQVLAVLCDRFGERTAAKLQPMGRF
jgi:hypothetical protein